MAEQTSRSGRLIANSQPKVCFHFQRHGACKFGERCKYSHDISLQEPAPRLRPPVDEPPPDGKFQQWKRLLRQRFIASRPPPTDVALFFQLGRDLMEGDIGVSQEVVKLLATDPGLCFIKSVTEQNTEAVSAFGLWATQLEPLFQMISHPRLTDSAVLEQQVATIYNFLLGVGGSRMTRLFQYIGRLVQNWPTTTTDTSSSMAAIELSLAVLSKILDCNTTNIVNESFSTFVSLFAECVKASKEPKETFSRLQAIKYLDYMRLRLESGDEIQEWNIVSKANPVREQFVLRRDLPGHLSAQGPRHDNDKAEIPNINILPTWEEIMSVRDEYLPTADSSQWHIHGIRGRLDREFRLVREDTVGQVRDAVFLAFEKLHKTPSSTRDTRNAKNTARTYIYEEATAVDVTFSRFSGLELTVRCNQLPAVGPLKSKEREAWWMQSKRLQVGALVCALNPIGSVLFCSVSTSTMRTKGDRQIHRKDAPGQEDAPAKSLTLSDDPDFLCLKLELVSAGRDEVGKALRWYRSLGSRSSWCLVEFPGVLLASFKYTLEALQRMYQKPDIPFCKVLEPVEPTSFEDGMNPPLYARAAGFTFNMNCLSHDGREMSSSSQAPITPKELASRSPLDFTQSAALLNTLSREVSLIQGPPGTGKSYTGEKIIKVLLENKERAKLGPILCVCYTNHALDQLLEHLLDGGIDKIIRIGSRSKSERLEGLNLMTVARASSRTKAEKHRIYEVESSINSIKREMDEELDQLKAMESASTLKKHLLATHPQHHDELFGKDGEDGWTLVVHSSHDQLLDRWLAGGSGDDGRCRRIENLQTCRLQRMNHGERRAIHAHWLHTIRGQIIPLVQDHHDEFSNAEKTRARARHDVDLRCLQQAQVVGATTTGLARSLDLLQKLRCKVMLCEEAGEVLEAHILTALLPSLEHAILIGDHLQLRPQIQNYELQSTNPRGREYSLDVSLFERLVQPPDDATDRLRVPLSVLETQRRMHPDIAQLVRSTLYHDLKDSEAVKTHRQVIGIRDRLFWFHHEKLEASASKDDPTNTSHHNEFEVEMTVSLVSHLFRQGEYSHGDIAVLTPYLGQLHRLRRRMESMFEISVSDRDLEALEAVESDAAATPRSLLNKSTLLKSVRVATVDNFQGEEAKVVVISLVRSNPQNRCGFLSTSNRINVLLSRARNGMYIIGNANTCQHVPMWAEVIAMLKTTSRFGTSLELQCPRHPDARLSVSQPDDFLQISPESGCNLLCNKRLHCGHTCSGRCHSDALHNAVKCLEKCPRPKKGCHHPCPLPCGEACQEKCLAKVEAGVTLPCGHHHSPAQCWEVQAPGSVWCKVKVTRTVPGCEHRVQVACHKDVTTASYQCTAQCGFARKCGHECKSQCFRCNTRKNGEITAQNHGICESKCGRNSTTCPHSCSQRCHGDQVCPPCKKECQASCSHSSCGKPCHEPCAPCAEATCPSRCPHSECTMPCAAPCDWMPCGKRCPERLSCGHQCPSLCGEPCPDERFCQQCGLEEIQSTCVDFIEMKEYREIDLDQEPCIFPQCGHFLTVTSMDGQMEMSSYYELDKQGSPTSINRRSEPMILGGKVIQVCGTCRGSLRSIARYGRIVRRALLDEATKKFIIWSASQHQSLTKKLSEQAEILRNKPAPTRCEATSADKSFSLPTPRLRQLRQLAEHVGHQRYDSIIGLWRTLYKYAAMVRKEEQPFQRVADLVRHANRLNQTRNEFVYDESVVQVKGSLSAEMLLLECELVVLSDFVQLRKKTPWIRLEEVTTDLSTQLKACKDVIQSASTTHHPKEEARAHMFAARLYGLCLALDAHPRAIGSGSVSSGSEAEKKTRDEGLHHVRLARALLDKFPSVAAVLIDSIDAAEATLNDGVYRSVTAEEQQAVSDAMAIEFRGTGHWYRCANGHLFAIGECGMPMQEAACPECGARIGGLRHELVDGVSRADDMDRLAAGVTRLHV